MLAQTRIDLANSIRRCSEREQYIANSTKPEVEVKPKNIMGVVVPNVSGTNLRQSFQERNMGFVGSSPYIDEAADSYGNLIENIVKAAVEMEAAA